MIAVTTGIVAQTQHWNYFGGRTKQGPEGFRAAFAIYLYISRHRVKRA